jgi:DNA polymerase-3 subunit chi
MSQVDFYVLNARGETNRQRFACRLAEKAYRLNNTVHIQVADQQSAAQLDELLWIFRDGSFVPHEVLDVSAGKPASPVTIGSDSLPDANCDLLINLTNSIPQASAAFPRVAEIVTSDDESKKRSRQRFVEYRSEGHNLDSHKL